MKSIPEGQSLISKRVDKGWAVSILAEVKGDDDPRWPWTLRLTDLGGGDLNQRWSEVWRWILEWTSWASANQCELRTANRRVGGTIRAIPERLIVPTIDIAVVSSGVDLIRPLDELRARARALHAEFPATLTPAFLRSACRLSDTDFELARAAADWFRCHDASGRTARQIPIAGLHAKWLDGHKGLVTGLSGHPELGLVERPSRVHFTYLDGEWLERGNRRRDSISLDEATQVPGYRPQVVLVTENKDTALFFPQVPGCIVIEGSGDAATRLGKIKWIRECPNVVYWGDLDARGLAILDRLRAAGVDATAILMDETTLHDYAIHASPTYADGSPLPCVPQPPTPYLSADERALLEKITDPEWQGARRIEQERIPLEVAHGHLLKHLNRANKASPSAADGER